MTSPNPDQDMPLPDLSGLSHEQLVERMTQEEARRQRLIARHGNIAGRIEALKKRYAESREWARTHFGTDNPDEVERKLAAILEEDRQRVARAIHLNEVAESRCAQIEQVLGTIENV